MYPQGEYTVTLGVRFHRFVEKIRVSHSYTIIYLGFFRDKRLFMACAKSKFSDVHIFMRKSDNLRILDTKKHAFSHFAIK